MTDTEKLQRATVPSFFTDVLIDELRNRDFVVLAKQQYEALTYQPDTYQAEESVLERTDVPV